MSTKTLVKKKTKTRAVPVVESQKLIDLARTIRRTYDTTEKLLIQAQKVGTETIAEAIQCGKALNEAKELVGHGGWLKWLAKHCKEVTDRTARKYMALASANRNHGSVLRDCKSLRQAYIAVGIIPEIETPTPTPAPAQKDTAPTPEMRKELNAPIADRRLKKPEERRASKTAKPATEVAEPRLGPIEGSFIPAMTMWNAWLDEGKKRLAGMTPEAKEQAVAALKGAFADEL